MLSVRLARRAVTALNAGTVRAGIETASPVRGFPARRAARWRVVNLPKPEMVTASPISSASSTADTTASTAVAASALAEAGKLSSNRIANWPIAAVQSTGRFQRMPAFRIAGNSSLVAASSLGKMSRVLMILRNNRCRLSTHLSCRSASGSSAGRRTLAPHDPKRDARRGRPLGGHSAPWSQFRCD